MKIVRARDYEEMSRRAAAVIASQVLLRPDSVLGLATGSSPVGTYQQLIEWYRKGDLDFSAIRTVTTVLNADLVTVAEGYRSTGFAGFGFGNSY